MKPLVPQEYVQIQNLEWQPFPDAFSEGGIRWKLLHVSPELGAWTAIFDCPTGSSFASHIHVGPGEYLLTKGKMEVRGGVDEGGATALALGYGYESCGARHDKTYFPEPSEFYMTFLGAAAVHQCRRQPARGGGMGAGSRPVGVPDRPGLSHAQMRNRPRLAGDCQAIISARGAHASRRGRGEGSGNSGVLGRIRRV